MAYQQRYNPDSLPAFAEPERRHSHQPPINNSNSQVPPGQPRPYQQQAAPPGAPPTSTAQAAMYGQQYGHSPQPPPPQAAYQQHLAPQPPPPGHGGYNYGTSPPGAGPGLAPAYGAGGYGQAPPPNQYASRPAQSPNPQMQGQGRYGQQPPMSRPPPSPAPQDRVDPSLFPLFKAVDKDGSGKLTERELRSALVNGDWTSFDPHTVRMMVRMFDTDRDGTIGFEEFCGLWGFLAAWRELFDRFDTDRSGNISQSEYTNALVAFGYRLSPQFTRMLFNTFDKRREGAISFDMFVQSCISLKRMTDVFKKYDDDRDGFITLSFEDFLTEIIKQNI